MPKSLLKTKKPYSKGFNFLPFSYIQWVQDKQEQEMVFSKGVSKVPPTPLQDQKEGAKTSPHTFTSIHTNDWEINKEKGDSLEKVLGESGSESKVNKSQNKEKEKC